MVSPIGMDGGIAVGQAPAIGVINAEPRPVASAIHHKKSFSILLFILSTDVDYPAYSLGFVSGFGSPFVCSKSRFPPLIAGAVPFRNVRL